MIVEALIYIDALHFTSDIYVDLVQPILHQHFKPIFESYIRPRKDAMFSWFQVPTGTVTECSAADKLEEIKRWGIYIFLSVYDVLWGWCENATTTFG